MKKDYYLIGEILYGMRNYFNQTDNLDYLKKYIKEDGIKYPCDINKFKFLLGSDEKNLYLDAISLYVVGKDENNNYVIGTNCKRNFNDMHSDVIYKDANGRRVYENEFGFSINPYMMEEFHKEYSKLINSDEYISKYVIKLGNIDGLLPNAKIEISKEMFAFFSGNIKGTPQYEKDRRRFTIIYSDIAPDVHVFAKRVNENIMDLLIKVLTIKVPKNLLHPIHQNIIENNCINDSKQIISDIIEMVIVIDENTRLIDPPKRLTLK